ncbi:hypothetical protein SeMB42_g06827 [Synchytrium endobioticum]|uniref:Rho-GAP domain-containing protein n=1 Tax=Synchytrium endobioticum TaxID=286115 RepID=A0A507CE20_9FUNG|nr:hypothetical protein SeMB42_g06827 [Synchytrium endobioticum]TPX40330.1 hypothetical protein SeLEV6574_g06668 [Synchytrium endobioticum]
MTAVAPINRPASEADIELRDLVRKKLILEAGVDFESKPIVSLYACHLPDPRQTNYDRLLELIKARLDEFVESDYVLVLFSAGAAHHPPWTWLYAAYKQLGRKYRKNLKNLYIVHPNMITKVLLQVMGAVISPKFFKKVVTVQSLSQLECLIPMKHLVVPDVITEINIKFEPKAASSQASNSQMAGPKRFFGARLDDVMGKNGELGVPVVIADSIAHIRQGDNLRTEGLFRRSPASHKLKEVKNAYERGERVDLSQCEDVHVACVLMKMFYRELAQPIFPESTYNALKILTTLGHAAAPHFIRSNILPNLSPPTRILLKATFSLLHDVSLNSSHNLMTPHNLTVVWVANMFRSDNPLDDFAAYTAGGGGLLLMQMIEKYRDIFDDDGILSSAVEVVKTVSLRQSGTGTGSTDASAIRVADHVFVVDDKSADDENGKEKQRGE